MYTTATGTGNSFEACLPKEVQGAGPLRRFIRSFRRQLPKGSNTIVGSGPNNQRSTAIDADHVEHHLSHVEAFETFASDDGICTQCGKTALPALVNMSDEQIVAWAIKRSQPNSRPSTAEPLVRQTQTTIADCNEKSTDSEKTTISRSLEVTGADTSPETEAEAEGYPPKIISEDSYMCTCPCQTRSVVPLQHLLRRVLEILGNQATCLESAYSENETIQQDAVSERSAHLETTEKYIEAEGEAERLRQSLADAEDRYSNVLQNMMEGSINADLKIQSMSSKGQDSACSSRPLTPQERSEAHDPPAFEATLSGPIPDDLKKTLTAHYVLTQQLTSVQKERDALLQTVQTVKKCIRCKEKFKILNNQETCCRYHPGRVRYFSCISCGGEKYFDCCNKCDKCSKGCRVGAHVAP